MNKTKVSFSENYINPFETGYVETGVHDFTKIKNKKLRDEYCGNGVNTSLPAENNTANEEKQSKNPLEEVLKNRRLII